MNMTATLPLPEKRLLTGQEAAQYCGVSVTTFRSLVPVSPVRIGGAVRFDRVELDRWITKATRNEPLTAEDWLDRLDADEDQRA